jgi:hypothetical protein
MNATLITLDPAPSVTVGDLEIIATVARRTEGGLEATVQARGEGPVALRTVALTDAADRVAYAAEVAAAGAEVGSVEAALMELATAVEGALRDAETPGEPRQSLAAKIVALTHDVEFFHTPDHKPFATVPVGDHHETYKVESQSFKRWLSHRLYEQTGAVAARQALQDALGTLEGRALYKGREYPVAVRLAEHEGAYFLDLTDNDWWAVEVTPHGWRVVGDPPVKFKRSCGMLALPKPEHEGDISLLRPFVNVEGERDWKLVVAWLVAALRPKGPYPVLVLQGEQGSAKSTLARVLRDLVDPNKSPLRAEPREGRDLAIAAANTWLQVFDNLSWLSTRFSDELCRLATGAGFATRQLYTDEDEALFDFQRPVILNGIEEFATRADLLDRALVITLPRIGEERRRSEHEFWREFHAARPKILGALLDAVAGAMAELPNVRLERRPRLADFALWATAAEGALGWDRNAFIEAYDANRADTNALALEATPVGYAVLDFARDHGRWEGTATQLLRELNGSAPTEAHLDRAWPRTAKALGGQLRRLAPNLLAAGVAVTKVRVAHGQRHVVIERK